MSSYMYLIPEDRRDAVAKALRDLPGGLVVHFEKDAAPRPVTGIEGLRANAAELEELARTVTIHCDIVSARRSASSQRSRTTCATLPPRAARGRIPQPPDHRRAGSSKGPPPGGPF